MDCQLVLAGGSATTIGGRNRPGRSFAAKPRTTLIFIFFNLPPWSATEINALQRASTVIVQKSLREGFGLTVTEALWKKKQS